MRTLADPLRPLLLFLCVCLCVCVCVCVTASAGGGIGESNQDDGGAVPAVAWAFTSQQPPANNAAIQVILFTAHRFRQMGIYTPPCAAIVHASLVPVSDPCFHACTI